METKPRESSKDWDWEPSKKHFITLGISVEPYWTADDCGALSCFDDNSAGRTLRHLPYQQTVLSQEKIPYIDQENPYGLGWKIHTWVFRVNGDDLLLREAKTYVSEITQLVIKHQSQDSPAHLPSSKTGVLNAVISFKDNLCWGSLHSTIFRTER